MKLTKILTVTLALALCVSTLAACSSNSGTNTGSTGNTNNTTGSTEKDDPAKTLIGMVTEKGNYYLTVTKYTAATEVTDFAALDITTLTKTDNSEKVTIGNTTKYSVVENGALKDGTADSVTAGSMVAVTTDAKGVQQVIVLATPAATETDLLGKVTFVGSDFLLMTLYTSAEEITDYTTLDIATLTAGETVAYVILNSETAYQTVTDGALANATAADVKADTMIAVTADDAGKIQIIILPASTASTPEEAA